MKSPQRIPAPPVRDIKRDLKWGMTWGVAIAVALSALMSIVADYKGTRQLGGFALATIVAAYIVSGLVGGALAGILRPALRSKRGSVFAVATLATVVYTVLALIAFPTLTWRHLAVGPICGVVFAIFRALDGHAHDESSAPTA